MVNLSQNIGVLYLPMAHETYRGLSATSVSSLGYAPCSMKDRQSHCFAPSCPGSGIQSSEKHKCHLASAEMSTDGQCRTVRWTVHERRQLQPANWPRVLVVNKPEWYRPHYTRKSVPDSDDARESRSKSGDLTRLSSTGRSGLRAQQEVAYGSVSGVVVPLHRGDKHTSCDRGIRRAEPSCRLLTRPVMRYGHVKCDRRAFAPQDLSGCRAVETVQGTVEEKTGLGIRDRTTAAKDGEDPPESSLSVTQLWRGDILQSQHRWKSTTASENTIRETV
ncbi:hypothetical protein BDW22DRAFT_1344890 [Trametopsis cervina]|nr:hypothetical protein BDW22DRAFT_1344890 [Trametopsis cervina]